VRHRSTPDSGSLQDDDIGARRTEGSFSASRDPERRDCDRLASVHEKGATMGGCRRPGTLPLTSSPTEGMLTVVALVRDAYLRLLHRVDRAPTQAMRGDLVRVLRVARNGVVTIYGPA